MVADVSVLKYHVSVVTTIRYSDDAGTGLHVHTMPVFSSLILHLQL